MQNQTELWAKEWIKCRMNPFYFIYNYVYIPEIGSSLKITPELLHPKLRRIVRIIYKYHKGILYASRQLGKSTIAAMLIVWSVVFFPRNKVIILNFSQKSGLNNLATIKFIISKLPDWMISKKPFKSKSDIKTYIELFNDSRVDVFYPSTTHSPDTLARSLTSPILYVDEAAHIRAMQNIFGSAQQTLSKARIQAVKNKYPYWILITSTSNGTEGDGKWFYNRYTKATNSDKLFVLNDDNDEIWNPDINIEQEIIQPNKNSFIRVKYHWSEDPLKDQKWYEEQCRELDDQRKVNQELDLLFVGTKNCIFTDETLKKFTSVKPIEVITTPNAATLNVYTEPDIFDWYIIGCDTAESLTGAFCAIEVYGFKNFNQIADLQNKYGSYTLFAKDIDYVFQWLYQQVGPRIILVVENNTIGKAPIENIIYNKDILINKDFDYTEYLYSDNDKSQYGVKTTGLTKPLMIGCLIEAIGENIKGIKSQDLIDQCSSMNRTANGTVKSSSYSDLFMATTFCAYVRNIKSLEIMPKINKTSEEIQQEQFNQLKQIAGLNKLVKLDMSDEIIYDENDENDEFNMLMPIINIF